MKGSPLDDPRDTLNAIESMTDSAGWKMLRERLENHRDHCLREIVSIDTPLENVPFLRGKLQTLEFILDSPEVIARQCFVKLDKVESPQPPNLRLARTR